MFSSSERWKTDCPYQARMVRAARGVARKNIPLLYFFWIALVPKHPETETTSAVSVAGWEQHSAGAFPKAVICTLSRWPTFTWPNPLNVLLWLLHILHIGSWSKDYKTQLYEFLGKLSSEMCFGEAAMRSLLELTMSSAIWIKDSAGLCL